MYYSLYTVRTRTVAAWATALAQLYNEGAWDGAVRLLLPRAPRECTRELCARDLNGRKALDTGAVASAGTARGRFQKRCGMELLYECADTVRQRLERPERRRQSTRKG